MDTSEYMPMFLAEAQEHLQELNLAVVELEDDPANQETVDGIFRIAHSLKGMSATMGFVGDRRADPRDGGRLRAAASAHRRAREEAITTVLACLDALQAALESIEPTAGTSTPR